MKKIKYGQFLVYTICAFLLIASLFEQKFVLYDFHANFTDYDYLETHDEKPEAASTGVWFAFGNKGKQFQYGVDEGMPVESLTVYSLTADGGISAVHAAENPISADSQGFFIASLPPVKQDINDDSIEEIIYDYARADLGTVAFTSAGRRFGHPEIPFELIFFERNRIKVYFQNEVLSNTDILVTLNTGKASTYTTDNRGQIEGLSRRDIQNGFTASFSPDQETAYRMYYVPENYPYFSEHYFAAYIPLLIVSFVTAIGILAVEWLRGIFLRKRPEYQIYRREHTGVYPYTLCSKTDSKFLMIRWLCLWIGAYIFAHGGFLRQGQMLNKITVPVFACPENPNQIFEPSCWHLSHLGAANFGILARDTGYIIAILVTSILFSVLIGRIVCGFLCPIGLLQDLMDKLRQILHIRPIYINERTNKILQPIKWVWIILFLGYSFTGKNFCDICPVKIFTTAQDGHWSNFYLNGFLAVAVLIGSFFIKRFWCIMCPMGYLLGIFNKFNLFKLKKDCTACTECGACYEACPMRLKNIYTERDKSNVQTVDCLMCGECIHKCPETDALQMSFCGKTIYKSSRKAFISKYAPKGRERS